MTRTSPPQVAFSSGEISPLLHRRFDYQRFQTGLAACRGFLPIAEGAVTRAPGTWYRGRSAADAAARLVPFIFAADDAVVLEFTPNLMRVWRYGALVMNGPSPYQLATPFGAADLPNLRWVQSADVLYMVDGAHPVQRLARFALNNWTIGAQPFSRGPFRVQNLNEALTIQASARTGAITLTASSAIFTAGHVGTLLRLKPANVTNIHLWKAGDAVAVGALRRYDGRIYELIARTGADVENSPPIHDQGDYQYGSGNSIIWRYICDDTGVVRITAVTDATHASATVIRTVPPDCVASPTYRWSEGAWSSIHGYPSALEIYEQRLVAAATPAEPRSIWFSAVGDYADFLDGTEADEAFGYTIAGSGSMNRIINIFAARAGLHIMALGEEFSTRSESRGQAIGPTTAVFGRDSGIGSSPARPIAPAGDPIFISRDGRRVHVISYSLEADANRAKDISRPASQLGASRFGEIVWQGAPLSTAWLRMGSGDLAAMVYDPAEEILGWAPVPVAGGVVESLAVTPAPDGSLDVLTMVVRRTINGQTRRHIEDQAAPFGALSSELAVSEACHLFAALRFAPPAPAESFSLPHLEGETVVAWTSEGHVDDLTVGAGGAITLPWPVDWAVIGLFDASHQVETLDITAQSPDGSSMGRRKRLHDQGGVGLHATAQLRAQAVEHMFGRAPVAGRSTDLVVRPVAAPGADVFSGISPLAPPTGQATEVSYRFTPVGGAPATLTAIVPFVQEAGR